MPLVCSEYLGMNNSSSSNQVMIDNNFDRLALARCIHLVELNYGEDSHIAPHRQKVIHCMMDDYSDINFDDDAFQGLLEILNLTTPEIQDMTIEDLERKFTDKIKYNYTFCADIRSDGFSKIYNASKHPDGLKVLNQMLKYMWFNDIDLSAINVDACIDTEEKSLSGGDVWSMALNIRTKNVTTDSEYNTGNDYLRNVYLSTNLNNLLKNSQSAIDDAVAKYLGKSWHDDMQRYIHQDTEDTMEYAIQSISIHKGHDPVLEGWFRHDISSKEKQSFNFLPSLNKFKVLSDDPAFLGELNESEIGRYAIKAMKGRVLENALGL